MQATEQCHDSKQKTVLRLMAFRRLQQISREVIRARRDTEFSVKEGGGDVLKQSNNLARSSKPEPNLH